MYIQRVGHCHLWETLKKVSQHDFRHNLKTNFPLFRFFLLLKTRFAPPVESTAHCRQISNLQLYPEFCPRLLLLLLLLLSLYCPMEASAEVGAGQLCKLQFVCVVPACVTRAHFGNCLHPDVVMIFEGSQCWTRV